MAVKLNSCSATLYGVVCDGDSNRISAGMQQLAAEKKLLKAEVASLKRQATEQLATLRMLQQEYDQVNANTSICTPRGLPFLLGHLFDI